jgi:myosin heavy subunit
MDRFDPVLCLRQLKYAGLFEAIHIRKAGFSIRMPVMQFIQRYKHCSMASMKVKRTDFPSLNLRDLALAMLNELAPKLGIVNPTTGMPTWAVGLTRVFFRTLKVKYALEECRNNSVDFVALQIQRYARFLVSLLPSPCLLLLPPPPPPPSLLICLTPPSPCYS